MNTTHVFAQVYWHPTRTSGPQHAQFPARYLPDILDIARDRSATMVEIVEIRQTHRGPVVEVVSCWTRERR